MKYYKMKRAILSLICALSLISSMVSVPVAAADTNCVTATTSTNVNQGSYGYCYVYIDSLENLASLDVAVYFDSSKVKVINVYNNVSCSLYDSVINEGEIQFTYLFDGQGANTKTRLFYFRYQVLDTAKIGDTYFDITIGEAYDSELNTVAVSGSRCSFTIGESVAEKWCYVYGTSALSTSVGEEFTLNYDFNTNEIASGTAVITYDAELFEVVEVSNGEFLAEKIVDINSELNGEVYISFVGTEYGSSKDFVTVTFQTRQNITDTSSIGFQAREFCDQDLNGISCNGYTTEVSVVFDETYVEDAPKMYLDGTYSYKAKKITLEVLLEENSYLGAADFVIRFDPACVSYVSSTKEFEPSMFQVNDKNVSEGELKFHIVSTEDIVSEELVLSILFEVVDSYVGESTEFELEASGVTDSLTNKIPLNLIGTTVTMGNAGYTVGDVNADEEVNDRDAVYLLYYTFLPEEYPVNQDCDFDGDGEVTDQDAIYLLYYTFLPDSYPLD